MDAGDLDRRIDLLKRTLSQNTLGEQVETFSPFQQVWAQVIEARGRDYYMAAQVHHEETTTFRIRFRTDISSIDRIGYKDDQFNIVSTSELGRREGLELIGVKAQN